MQALRAALEERDQRVAALQEKLSMSKEALQGHKEKHSEKVQKLEHLVLQLRQKMSEGASGEGDAVWAQRLAEERERRDALQNELDRLAVMFERVEKEVQRQRGPEAHLLTDAEERVNAAVDEANRLKDENLRMRSEMRGLEGRLARANSGHEPKVEALPMAHLGYVDAHASACCSGSDALGSDVCVPRLPLPTGPWRRCANKSQSSQVAKFRVHDTSFSCVECPRADAGTRC